VTFSSPLVFLVFGRIVASYMRLLWRLRNPLQDLEWTGNNITIMLKTKYIVLVQCLVSLIPLSHFLQHFCGVYKSVTTSWHQMYSVGPLLDATCNFLGYRRHHSIYYTVLFPTPRVVITIFLLTLSSGPPISCLGAVLWRLLSWMLAANWLVDCY
jgi:hypothetical protein